MRPKVDGQSRTLLVGVRIELQFRSLGTAAEYGLRQFRPEELCRVWNLPEGPVSQRVRVNSDVPVLVVSGTFDAKTGAVWGRYAASARTWIHLCDDQRHRSLGHRPVAVRA